MRLIIITVIFTFIIGANCHLGILHDVFAGTGSRIHGKIHDGLHTVASAVTGGLNGGLHFEFGGHAGANHHHGTETEVINVYVPEDQPNYPRYPQHGQQGSPQYNQNQHNQGSPQNQGYGHGMNFQHHHNQGQMQYDQNNYGKPQHNEQFHNNNEPNLCNYGNHNGCGGHDISSQGQYNHHDQNNHEKPMAERPHNFPHNNEQQSTNEENHHEYTGHDTNSQGQNNQREPPQDQNTYEKPVTERPDNLPHHNEPKPKPISNGETNSNFDKPAPNKQTTKKPDSDDNPLFIPLNQYEHDKKESNSPKRDTKTEAEKDDEFDIDIRFKDQ